MAAVALTALLSVVLFPSSPPAQSATQIALGVPTPASQPASLTYERTIENQSAQRHALVQVAELSTYVTDRVASYVVAVHQAQLAQFVAAYQRAQFAKFVAAQAAQTPPAAVATAPSAPVDSAPSAGNPAGDTVTDFQRAAWDKVNMCEEGGVWDVDGPVYAGGLGFSRANWAEFNTFGFPADAADATPDQQIQVATQFALHYYGSVNAAPDQNGCGGATERARRDLDRLRSAQVAARSSSANRVNIAAKTSGSLERDEVGGTEGDFEPCALDALGDRGTALLDMT